MQIVPLHSCKHVYKPSHTLLHGFESDTKKVIMFSIPLMYLSSKHSNFPFKVRRNKSTSKNILISPDRI